MDRNIRNYIGGSIGCLPGQAFLRPTQKLLAMWSFAIFYPHFNDGSGQVQ